jgi:hypothetical protein
VRALPFVLLAFVLAGCAFGGESTPESTGGNGLTRYEISAGRFAIGVPPTWHATSASQMEKASFKRFASQNPAFAAYANAIGKKRSPFKFFVLVKAVPKGTTWDAYRRGALGEAKSLAVGRVAATDVDLPAGKALRVEYRTRFVLNGRKRTTSTTQYGLLLEDTSYVLTYTTLPSARNEYADWFKLSAESFRLTNG